MAKKKSKKSKEKKKKNTKVQGEQQHLGFLGTSVQQIATTIAGVVATQLVEAIVDRLTDKFPILRTGGSSPADTPKENPPHYHAPDTPGHPVQEAALISEETPSTVASTGQQAVNVLKSTVAEVAPAMGGVVDLFKNGVQRVIEKSETALDGKVQPVVDSLATAAQGIVGQINTDNVEQPKKGKKKDKKKKKKK